MRKQTIHPYGKVRAPWASNYIGIARNKAANYRAALKITRGPRQDTLDNAIFESLRELGKATKRDARHAPGYRKRRAE